MCAKFRNIFCVESTRLSGYDYGRNGAYFMTICTEKRKNYFGEIIETNRIDFPNEMRLNSTGEIAKKFWGEIPNFFPFVLLDEFIVMPNHIHGIIVINKPDNKPNVETRLIASLQSNGGFAGLNNPMMHENVSRVIRWFKGRCSFEIHKINSQFPWQTRFYDHVIQNEKSLMEIREYIFRNVQNWNSDRNNHESDDYFDF